VRWYKAIHYYDTAHILKISLPIIILKEKKGKEKSVDKVGQEERNKGKRRCNNTLLREIVTGSERKKEQRGGREKQKQKEKEPGKNGERKKGNVQWFLTIHNISKVKHDPKHSRLC